MLKAISFDAAGTLIKLTRSVGENYAYVGEQIGLRLNAEQLDAAFRPTWKALPSRKAIGGPRDDDDKGLWHDIVFRVLDRAAPGLSALDRDNFFEVAYEHFAEAGVWELFPDVVEVLAELQPRYQLAVISNFDGRLRFVLEHLGVRKFFKHVFVSSELGADKPDPEIFRRALRIMEFPPEKVLHVGDDPVRDWRAAELAGLKVFKLDRTHGSLRSVAAGRGD